MKGWSAAAYLRFLAMAALVVAALLAVGWGIDRRIESASFEDIAAAILSCALATAVSGLLLAVPGGTPQAALSRFLVAMALRLVLVAALSVWCLVGLGVARDPFVVSLVAAYLALLGLDTLFAVRALGSL